MKPALPLLLVLVSCSIVVACASADSPSASSSSNDDAGSSAEASGPSDVADGGKSTSSDGNATSDCVIDMALPGPPEFSGPFSAKDLTAESGKVSLLVDVGGVVGPMDAPIVECRWDASGLVLRAEGKGYSGMTGVTLSFAGAIQQPRIVDANDDLAASVSHEDVGKYEHDTSTRCQVCVEPGKKSGLYRCDHLSGTAGALTVLRGAFSCP